MSAHWSDLAWLVYNLFARDYHLPFATISVGAVPSSPFVPAELRAVYPAEVPAVSIRFLAQHTDHVLNLTLDSGEQTAMAGNVAVRLAGATTLRLDTSAQGELLLAMGLPPLGGGVNVSVVARYVRETDEGVVVTKNQSKLLLHLMYHTRSPGTFERPPMKTFPITLPVGVHITEGLRQAFAALAPPFNRMLGVATSVSRLTNGTLIAIQASRVQGAGEAWHIPRSLGITDSSNPLLYNISDYRSTSRILLRNTAIRAEAVLAMDAAATVALGLVACSADAIDGRANISMVVRPREAVTNLGAVSAALLDGNPNVPNKVSFWNVLEAGMLYSQYHHHFCSC